MSSRIRAPTQAHGASQSRDFCSSVWPSGAICPPYGALSLLECDLTCIVHFIRGPDCGSLVDGVLLAVIGRAKFQCTSGAAEASGDLEEPFRDIHLGLLVVRLPPIVLSALRRSWLAAEASGDLEEPFRGGRDSSELSWGSGSL